MQPTQYLPGASPCPDPGCDGVIPDVGEARCRRCGPVLSVDIGRRRPHGDSHRQRPHGRDREPGRLDDGGADSRRTRWRRYPHDDRRGEARDPKRRKKPRVGRIGARRRLPREPASKERRQTTPRTRQGTEEPTGETGRPRAIRVPPARSAGRLVHQLATRKPHREHAGQSAPKPSNRLRDRLVRNVQLNGDRVIAPTHDAEAGRPAGEALVRRARRPGPEGWPQRGGISSSGSAATVRVLSFRVHQLRTADPRPRKESRRLLDDAPQVNSRWRPSLRAFSASTPSSASRSRPAPPVSSPGACPSSTSCSVPTARTPPSPQPGCCAVGGARWPTVPASRRLAARCPGTSSAPVAANRYRSAPARATPALRFAWPPCFRRRPH